MPIVGQFGSLAGLGSLILPGGAMESIATVTLASAAANIEFTSIPSGFQHLQLRLVARSDRNQSGDNVGIRVGNGSVDTGSNYAQHHLYGDGAGAYAAGYASQAYGYADRIAGNTATASIFGGIVIDILDYASTSKTKTLRCFGGCDLNGSGTVMVASNLWNSTSAINTLRVYPNAAGSSNFVQHTTAALYGLRAP